MNFLSQFAIAVAAMLGLFAVPIFARQPERPAPNRQRPTQQPGKRPGQQPDRARPGQQRGRGERSPDTLNKGDQAPDFTLNILNSEDSVTLSDFQGQKPVALVFGSYT